MLGFLIAVAAGAATPKIEDVAARPLAALLAPFVKIFDDELPVLAFMIALMCAAALGALLGGVPALALCIGGTVGYFGVRIVALVRKELSGE